MKAALASLAVADECAIPVVCGLATGADAPKSFRGDESQANRLCWACCPQFTNEGNKRSRWLFPSPSLGSVGKGSNRPLNSFVNGPQAPGRSSQSSRRIAGLAQRRVRALQRQGCFSATGRGLAFKRTPVRPSGWLRPGPNQFLASTATSRSGSNTVWFLSMK
jgi:hypothetical protein